MSITRGISARLRQCAALVRGSIMEGLTFRTSTFVTIIGNIVYLVLIYFLWRAIYDSSPTDTVNGMSFYDTMIYLVLASAMFNFMNNFVVWDLGRGYQSGEIVEFLVKPIDYQRYLFFATAGNSIVTFFITFLPTFFVIYFVTHGSFALGRNLLFFAVSVIFSIIINYCVDFFVGTICFYTQSIWGVNTMKEVVVSLLSGATIPLAFFPEQIRRIVDFLPFQAIYHTPLHMLTGRELKMADYLQGIGIQLFWVLVMLLISKAFWKRSLKALTINGG